MSDCPRFGKWFGGCKFEPRVDSPEMSPALAATLPNFEPFQTSILVDEDLEALRIIKGSTYVRDICIRCGKTIERSAP